MSVSRKIAVLGKHDDHTQPLSKLQNTPSFACWMIILPTIDHPIRDAIRVWALSTVSTHVRKAERIYR